MVDGNNSMMGAHRGCAHCRLGKLRMENLSCKYRLKDTREYQFQTNISMIEIAMVIMMMISAASKGLLILWC